MRITNAVYNREYYEKYEYGFRTSDRTDHDRMLELLDIRPEDRVLEVGCGLGVLLKRVPSNYKRGIETNDFAVAECCQRGLTVIKADAEQGLPFENRSFDVVILNNLIEHIRDPRSLLAECSRVLVVGGRIAITTPVRGFFVHDVSESHCSEMSLNKLKDLLENCGFRILEREVCGFSFVYPVLENLCYKPFRLLRYRFRSRSRITSGVDNCHNLADRFLLTALFVFRRRLLWLGATQLVIAQKR